jgi:hypothetical protein
MTFKTAFTATAAALLLSGCANGPLTGILLGGGVTIAEAEAAELALIDRVDDILAAEGDTLNAELPVVSTGSYNGIILGFDSAGGGGGGPDMVYYADLSVDVDFTNDTLDGEVTNFVTDVSGFQNPTGTALVTGTIGAGGGGFAELDFTATGTLVGPTATANYSATSTSGNFAGDSAQAAYGSHETEFIWIVGPDTATTSYSDGDWNIE